MTSRPSPTKSGGLLCLLKSLSVPIRLRIIVNKSQLLLIPGKPVAGIVLYRTNAPVSMWATRYRVKVVQLGLKLWS